MLVCIIRIYKQRCHMICYIMLCIIQLFTPCFFLCKTLLKQVNVTFAYFMFRIMLIHVQGSGSTQECLLLPVSRTSQELRHVIRVLLWPGARRLPVCILLSLHLHTATELPRQPRDERTCVLSAWTAHFHRCQYLITCLTVWLMCLPVLNHLSSNFSLVVF